MLVGLPGQASSKAGIASSFLFFQPGALVMLKKLLMLCLVLALSMGVAFAAVDVNTADQTSLEAVKGLGPVKSKALIDERTKNGPFKDADDLANRVKGLGTKSVTNLEQAGLTIGGSSAPPTGAKASKTPAATSAAPAKSTMKPSTAATAATPPAATTATAPAMTPEAASATTGKKGKKAKASAAASSSAATTADAASGASGAKASKKSKKKKAASDAAAT
jgi:competence protein ComEA